MQFSAATMAVLAAAVSAAPLAQRQEPTGFSVISSRSGSPVHLLPIAARGLQLWVGGETDTYCPAGSGINCDTFQNSTAFGAQPGNPTSIGMSTNVPGGQLLYISPDGTVRYTQAHSGAIPDGAVVAGFNYVAPTSSSSASGSLSPSANGSDAFFACPATAAQKETGPWQLIANVPSAEYPSGSEDDCYGFQAVAEEYDNVPAAWQYS